MYVAVCGLQYYINSAWCHSSTHAVWYNRGLPLWETDCVTSSYYNNSLLKCTRVTFGQYQMANFKTITMDRKVVAVKTLHEGSFKLTFFISTSLHEVNVVSSPHGHCKLRYVAQTGWHGAHKHSYRSVCIAAIYRVQVIPIAMPISTKVQCNKFCPASYIYSRTATHLHEWLPLLL